MVELKKISKIFNKQSNNESLALDQIDLKIDKGDFITLIGSNGSGKSTLLNVISGNLNCTSGSIFINGSDVSTKSEYMRAKNIGRIFQDPNLGTASNMTIEDNMAICRTKGFRGLKLALNRDKREYIKKRLHELNMGLEHRLKDNVSQLSGGQRQAMTLLMAAMTTPELLLLDEHTAALDPHKGDLVMNLTRKYVNEYNLTTLMVTHNMEQAIKYGNRLIMMDRGKIIFQTTGAEKMNLTVKELTAKFKEKTQRDLTNDQILLQ